MGTGVRYAITTARTRPAALATIDLVADEPRALEAFLAACVGDVPAVGGTPLRRLAGIDEGLVLRIGPGHAILMPHGGPAVLAELGAWLESRGAVQGDAACAHPEPSDPFERAVLRTLSRAASPLAVGILLAQPALWKSERPARLTDRDRRLRRLIDPPTVAAVGAPNVGKSSLLNALLGREAATVRDEAGTTRDYIGASVNLGGLVVRWVDTPGIRPKRGPETEAQRLATELIARADLVLRCIDAASDSSASTDPPCSDFLVATRCDLSEPGFHHDAAVSAKTGDGLAALVGQVRDRLVLPEDLADASPWVFDDGLLGGRSIP
ncbi:MAG: GTPase [Planctomycetota bacterium]